MAVPITWLLPMIFPDRLTQTRKSQGLTQQSLADAAGNRRKHGVGFELAATVFQDSLALSRFDEDRSETEERWVTLGQADNGTLLVVVHTYQEIDEHNAAVRIISARAATKRELRDYKSKP